MCVGTLVDWCAMSVCECVCGVGVGVYTCNGTGMYEQDHISTIYESKSQRILYLYDWPQMLLPILPLLSSVFCGNRFYS